MVAGVKLSLVGAAAATCLVFCGAPALGQNRIGEVVFERINRQSLDPGQCGLFLWSRGQEPTFIFVAFNEPSLARVRIDGESRALERDSFAGEAVLGHFERQVYEDRRMTMTVEIVVDETRAVRDGAVLKSGTITARTRRGWEIVTPVGGMIACERAQSGRRGR